MTVIMAYTETAKLPYRKLGLYNTYNVLAAQDHVKIIFTVFHTDSDDNTVSRSYYAVYLKFMYVCAYHFSQLESETNCCSCHADTLKLYFFAASFVFR